VLDVLHSERFIDQSPAEVHATLLEEQTYLCAPRGNSYTPPRELLQVYIDEFDRAYEEGTMFLLTTYPHIIGRRSRIIILEELIAHIQAKGDVWFATHQEVAEYVKAQAGM
jgi:hypothetical protein